MFIKKKTSKLRISKNDLFMNQKGHILQKGWSIAPNESSTVRAWSTCWILTLILVITLCCTEKPLCDLQSLQLSCSSQYYLTKTCLNKTWKKVKIAKKNTNFLKYLLEKLWIFGDYCLSLFILKILLSASGLIWSHNQNHIIYAIKRVSSG